MNVDLSLMSKRQVRHFVKLLTKVSSLDIISKSEYIQAGCCPFRGHTFIYFQDCIDTDITLFIADNDKSETVKISYSCPESQ